jgi:hypothetical protein
MSAYGVVGRGGDTNGATSYCGGSLSDCWKSSTSAMLFAARSHTESAGVSKASAAHLD